MISSRPKLPRTGGVETSEPRRYTEGGPCSAACLDTRRQIARNQFEVIVIDNWAFLPVSIPTLPAEANIA